MRSPRGVRTVLSFSNTSDEEASEEQPLSRRSSRQFGQRPWSRYAFLVSVLLSLTFVGVMVGMVFEGWHFITSLYVVVQVVTTIGYGDVTVTSRPMKVFMSFYVLGCLVVLGDFMNLQAQTFVEMQVSGLVRSLDSLEENGPTSTPSRSLVISPVRKTLIARTALFLGAVLIGTLFFRIAEHCSCSYGVSAVEGCRDTDFETCLETKGYVKTTIDSFYMSIITLTTVGFGDHTPRSKSGRIFGVFWMVIGVSMTAMWIEAVAKVFQEGAVEKRRADGEDLTDEVFQDMDRDGKGYLTRADFVCYTLVKDGLVPMEVIEKIDAVYDNFAGAADNAVTLMQVQKMSPSHKRLSRTVSD